MSVDGIALSPSGCDLISAIEGAQEIFVRIHPVITGNAPIKVENNVSQGFLPKDQSFVLKSIKDEGGGVARLHYIRAGRKQGNRS
jgi:hypothetical protein